MDNEKKERYFIYFLSVVEFLIGVIFVNIGDISFLNFMIPLKLFGIGFMVLSIMSSLVISDAWKSCRSF